MDACYCLYVHIFMKNIKSLNHLILTFLINSCKTSGFSKVGAIIKYNIKRLCIFQAPLYLRTYTNPLLLLLLYHAFPVLIKTVLKLVYIICKITLSGKLFHMLTIRLVKQYFRKSNLHLVTVSFWLLPLV